MPSNTTAKQRPIIFDAESVRAILAGRKTQTRRIAKAPKQHADFGAPLWDEAFRDKIAIDEYLHVPFDGNGDKGLRTTQRAFAPWQTGDLLYVKEAWRSLVTFDTLTPSEMATRALDAGYDSPWAPIHWEADGRRINWVPPRLGVGPGRYRNAWFMPRWASRLTLLVVSIRVERVQDISEADAKAEGVAPEMVDSGGQQPWGEWIEVPDYIGPFAARWDAIHGAGAWERNDWVWVIEFERVEVDDASE